MLYKLPTHGKRGNAKHQCGIRSISYSSRSPYVHVELCSGDRYMGTRDCFDGDTHIGACFFAEALNAKWQAALIKYGTAAIPSMEPEHYAALVAKARSRG